VCLMEAIERVARFSRREVLHNDLEKVPAGLILERRRISHIDHYLSAGECPQRASAIRRVDGRVRGGGNGIIALLLQFLHDLRTDQTSAANDHDLRLHMPRPPVMSVPSRS